MTDPARPDGAVPATTTIEEALDKNKKATEAVKEAADDLLVVHAVLNEEIPDEARTGPVDQAVEHTREVEKRLSESADQLEDVNTSLEKELERRDQASKGQASD